MLQQLDIQHYGLISSATLQPSTGLTIITGETGAGKSTLLGAMKLLMGERAAAKVVQAGARKCVVEGTFSVEKYNLGPFFIAHELDEDPIVLVRREVTAAGKSRAFINDTPVALKVLQALMEQLLVVHSQHDTLQLRSGAFQLAALDAYAGNTALLATYQQAYATHQAAFAHHQSLATAQKEAQKALSYHTFLLTELEKAELVAGEQEQLEERLRTLQHAATVQEQLTACLQHLEHGEQAACPQLAQAVQALQRVTDLKKSYGVLEERLASALIELRDAAAELEQEEREAVNDPVMLVQVEDRLSCLYQLQQKHQVQSVEDLLVLQEELATKVAQADDLVAAVEAAAKTCEATQAALERAAQALSAQRKANVAPFSAALLHHLQGVGMPSAQVTLSLKVVAPHQQGTDALTMLFSANKGVAPQPLGQVASGGEFARLMLCIKFMITAKQALPTLIFDEIDTGISGEVAVKVASMLAQMAMHHQLLAVTHLPQVAARGQCHYHMQKKEQADTTVSQLTLLTTAQRTLTLAQLLSGEQPSAGALANAAELLQVTASGNLSA